jgi:hypothetical protein
MHAVRYVLVAAMSAVLLVGCGGGDDDSGAAQADVWQGVAELRPRDGVLDVEAFRSHLESVDAEYEQKPETLVREYLGVADGELTVEGPRATLLRDSLEDDSVRAERWLLDVAKDGDTWTIVAARWEQRCHQNRGHQEFTPELCV